METQRKDVKNLLYSRRGHWKCGSRKCKNGKCWNISWVKNAGLEKARVNHRDGKCSGGKCRPQHMESREERNVVEPHGACVTLVPCGHQRFCTSCANEVYNIYCAKYTVVQSGSKFLNISQMMEIQGFMLTSVHWNYDVLIEAELRI